MLPEKILSTLVLPPGGLLLLAALGLWMAWRSWRLGLWLGGFALGLLWLLSMPVVADRLAESLEHPFPPQTPEAFPVADAIVVLGGGIEPPTGERWSVNLGSAADRYWMAARLWHAGRAGEILVSGGRLPWMGASVSEAEAAARFMIDLGVPASAILLEPDSRNTRENAELSARLLAGHGARRILLVTSAMHMRRAMARFADRGLEVIPAATDHESGRSPAGLLGWLPDSDALDLSRRAIKEIIGRMLGK